MPRTFEFSSGCLCFAVSNSLLFDETKGQIKATVSQCFGVSTTTTEYPLKGFGGADFKKDANIHLTIDGGRDVVVPCGTGGCYGDSEGFIKQINVYWGGIASSECFERSTGILHATPNFAANSQNAAAVAAVSTMLPSYGAQQTSLYAAGSGPQSMYTGQQMSIPSAAGTGTGGAAAGSGSPAMMNSAGQPVSYQQYGGVHSATPQQPQMQMQMQMQMTAVQQPQQQQQMGYAPQQPMGYAAGGMQYAQPVQYGTQPQMVGQAGGMVMVQPQFQQQPVMMTGYAPQYGGGAQPMAVQYGGQQPQMMAYGGGGYAQPYPATAMQR